jgi:hypothetical protein
MGGSDQSLEETNRDSVNKQNEENKSCVPKKKKILLFPKKNPCRADD